MTLDFAGIALVITAIGGQVVLFMGQREARRVALRKEANDAAERKIARSANTRALADLAATTASTNEIAQVTHTIVNSQRTALEAELLKQKTEIGRLNEAVANKTPSANDEPDAPVTRTYGVVAVKLEPEDTTSPKPKT